MKPIALPGPFQPDLFGGETPAMFPHTLNAYAVVMVGPGEHHIRRVVAANDAGEADWLAVEMEHGRYTPIGRAQRLGPALNHEALIYSVLREKK